jgi:hypothetical protein
MKKPRDFSGSRGTEQFQQIAEMPGLRLAEQFQQIAEMPGLRLAEQFQQIAEMPSIHLSRQLKEFAITGESIAARWPEPHQLLDLGNSILDLSGAVDAESSATSEEHESTTWSASDTAILWWAFVLSISVMLLTMQGSTDQLTRESATKLLGFLAIVAVVNSFRPKN